MLESLNLKVRIDVFNVNDLLFANRSLDSLSLSANCDPQRTCNVTPEQLNSIYDLLFLLISFTFLNIFQTNIKCLFVNKHFIYCIYCSTVLNLCNDTY